MKIERVDKPRYFYDLTDEEVTNVKETITIIERILDAPPMRDDDALVFDGEGLGIEEYECKDTIDFLTTILDYKGKEFY